MKIYRNEICVDAPASIAEHYVLNLGWSYTPEEPEILDEELTIETEKEEEQ